MYVRILCWIIKSIVVDENQSTSKITNRFGVGLEIILINVLMVQLVWIRA